MRGAPPVGMRTFRSIGVVGAALLVTSGIACDGGTEKAAPGADAMTAPDADHDDAAGQAGVDAGDVPDASQTVAESGQGADRVTTR